LKNPLK